MKDMRGTEIKVGDQLVWAHSWGRSSARLARGVVVGFTKQRIKFVGAGTLSRGNRSHTNIAPGNTVLVVNNEVWEDIEQAKNEGLIV